MDFKAESSWHGSEYFDLRETEQTAAKSIRSEQDPRWKKPFALKDPKQAAGVHTHFLHGQVTEPKATGATENDYPSLSLSVSGGDVGSG